MNRDRLIVLVWSVFLATTLGATAFWFAHYHAVWSPDSGALLAMAKSWARGGSPAYPHYSLESFDPDWILNPLTGQGYVAHTSHGHTLVYSPALPIIAGTAYRLLGFFGLALPSVLAGILGSIAALLTAREMGSKLWWAAGGLALITPLAVYGAVFWHHAPTICAAAWAFYFLVRGTLRDHSKSFVFAGLCLGIGLFFHELSLALALATAICLVPQWKSMGRFLGGFAVGGAAWMAMNLTLYGTALGPHVSGANNVLGSRVYRPSLFDVGAMVDRASVQLFGFPPGDYAVWLMAICLVGAFVAARMDRGRIALCFVGLLALFAVTTWPRQTVNNGLFQTTPLFALALAAPMGGKPDRALALRICGLFALLVVLNPIPPLMGWGSRFLVTVASPLLCLGLAAAEERGSRWLLVVLAGLGFVSQILGLRVVNDDLSYSEKLCEVVRSFNAPVFSELAWLGPECEAADLRQPLFVVGDTLYTPVDLQKTRAKAMQYLDKFRPPKVYLYGPSGQESIVDAAIRTHGYRAAEWGKAAGLGFTRYERE